MFTYPDRTHTCILQATCSERSILGVVHPRRGTICIKMLWPIDIMLRLDRPSFRATSGLSFLAFAVDFNLIICIILVKIFVL